MLLRLEVVGLGLGFKVYRNCVWFGSGSDRKVLSESVGSGFCILP